MVASSTAAYTNMKVGDITLPVIESHDDDIVGSEVCNDAQVQFDTGSTTLPVINDDADILVVFADRRIAQVLGSEHRNLLDPDLLSRADRRIEELGSEHRNLVDPHFMTRSLRNNASLWVRVDHVIMRSRPETEDSKEDVTPTTTSVAPSSAAVTPAATAAPKPSAPAPKSGKETKPDTARSGTAPKAWMALAEGNVQVLWNSLNSMARTRARDDIANSRTPMYKTNCPKMVKDSPGLMEKWRDAQKHANTCWVRTQLLASLPAPSPVKRGKRKKRATNDDEADTEGGSAPAQPAKRTKQTMLQVHSPPHGAVV
jgi:hypothetical protein